LNTRINIHYKNVETVTTLTFSSRDECAEAFRDIKSAKITGKSSWSNHKYFIDVTEVRSFEVC
jgi:hypothetical protein